MWFEVTLWSLVGGQLTIPKRSKKNLPGCSFHVDLHHFVKLTLPGKRESNLPCLFNGRKNRKISAIHICKSVKWRCAVDKIPAKGTWNWNHHGIWRGGICWTSLIWENGGETIQPKKNNRRSNKMLDFQKKSSNLLWERTLFPWKFPHFFGIFGVNPPSGPAHWPFQLETTGTFQRSKNGRFFSTEKNHTLPCTLKWMRKLRLCFCLKKSLVEEIQHIQHSRWWRWFATHLKHMSNHKSTWRWWFSPLIYLFLKNVRKSSNWIRKNSGKHHPSTCLLLAHLQYRVPFWIRWVWGR